jgi:outer membrane protein assembly factor BamD (BamD/ComL family)
VGVFAVIARVAVTLTVILTAWGCSLPIPEKEQEHFKAARELHKVQASREAYRFYEEFVERYPASELCDTALERMFEIALGHWKTWWGSKQLAELQEKYPAAPLAAEAAFRAGEYQFEKGNYDEAIIRLKNMIVAYSESERVEKAVFLTAESELRQYEGADYEAASLHRAKEHFELLLRTFPSGAYTQKARKQLRLISWELAHRDYLIALYYQKKGKIVSAKYYFNSVLKQYPETEYAARAQKILTAIAKSEK